MSELAGWLVNGSEVGSWTNGNFIYVKSVPFYWSHMIAADVERRAVRAAWGAGQYGKYVQA